MTPPRRNRTAEECAGWPDQEKPTGEKWRLPPRCLATSGDRCAGRSAQI